MTAHNRQSRLAQVVAYIDTRPACKVPTTCPVPFAGGYDIFRDCFDSNAAAERPFMRVALEKGWIVCQRHQVGTHFHDVFCVTAEGRAQVVKNTLRAAAAAFDRHPVFA